MKINGAKRTFDRESPDRRRDGLGAMIVDGYR